MPSGNHYDVICHLAPSGKCILLLERGDWLPREKQPLFRDVEPFQFKLDAGLGVHDRIDQPVPCYACSQPLGRGGDRAKPEALHMMYKSRALPPAGACSRFRNDAGKPDF